MQEWLWLRSLSPPWEGRTRQLVGKVQSSPKPQLLLTLYIQKQVVKGETSLPQSPLSWCHLAPRLHRESSLVGQITRPISLCDL